jgi:hypothetical protein
MEQWQARNHSANFAFNANNADAVPDIVQHSPTSITNTSHAFSEPVISEAWSLYVANAGKMTEIVIVRNAPTRLMTTDRYGRNLAMNTMMDAMVILTAVLHGSIAH